MTLKPIEEALALMTLLIEEPIERWLLRAAWIGLDLGDGIEVVRGNVAYTQQTG